MNVRYHSINCITSAKQTLRLYESVKYIQVLSLLWKNVIEFYKPVQFQFIIHNETWIHIAMRIKEYLHLFNLLFSTINDQYKYEHHSKVKLGYFHEKRVNRKGKWKTLFLNHNSKLNHHSAVVMFVYIFSCTLANSHTVFIGPSMFRDHSCWGVWYSGIDKIWNISWQEDLRRVKVQPFPPSPFSCLPLINVELDVLFFIKLPGLYFNIC